MYRISAHAAQRIKQRRLKAEWLVAALEGKRIQRENGYLFLVDRHTRTALVVEPQRNLIVTAVRLTKSRYRRILSVRRKGNRKWQYNT